MTQLSENTKKFRRIMSFLVDPVVPLESPEQELKSRWLALILVTFMPIGTILLISFRVMRPSDTPRGNLVFIVFPFTLFFWGAAYLLGRRGRYEIGSLLAMLLANFIIFLAIFQPAYHPLRTLSDSSFLIVPILFSSFLLSFRATTILLLFDLAALMLLPFVVDEVTISDVLIGPFGLILIGGLVSMLGAYLRDRLENYHTRSLRKEITDRQRAEIELRQSLDEKEVLLREIHHRVKNNMQVISSLLSLQANNMIDSAVQVQFQESQSRIRSMALVHEHLYQSDNLAAIDFCRYAHDLLAYLDSIHYISAHGIRLHIQTEDILLDIDSTLVCGLIINELVSNAAKHAFPNDAQGLIAVRLKKERSEHLVLSVQDNGIGLPEAYDFHNPLTLGLQLVFNLTRQLGGTIRIDQKSGTKVQIKFAAPKH